MNDPTKRIDVEKSSLLSLKAELLRKQEEVLKNKSTVNESKIKSSKLSKLLTKDQTIISKPNQDSEKINAKTIEYDDSMEMAKVKRKLEAKAKYYDRMVQSKSNFKDDGNSLVLFDKKEEERQPSRSYHSRRYSDEDYDDDEMVDYVDIFGRSRKIARKDLDKIKRQDADLTEAVESREEQAKPVQPQEPAEEESSDGSISSSENDNKHEVEEEEIIGPDIGLQFRKQRDQWEEQDEVNRQRVNLHYQDILFDEAREHGVGYYEFSTDHEEREKQQKELRKIHEGTLDAQEERNKLKSARDAILASRIKSAKQRVRQRLGLPENDNDDDEGRKDKIAEDSEATNSSDNKKNEIQRQQKEKLELLRESARKKHVRPWDKDKKSTLNASHCSSEDDEAMDNWQPMRERRVMSQEEWNEMKRSERNYEFAPMSFIKGISSQSSDKYSTEQGTKRQHQSPERRDKSMRTSTTSSTARHGNPKPSSSASMEDSISAGLRFLRQQIEQGNSEKFLYSKDK